MSTYRLLTGDALAMLRTLPDESVHCCVTSPPYWGLRDYGVAGQIGLEATPQEFVARMVAVFAEVRRVLRADGVVWLNCGDTYATGAGKVGDHPGGGEQGARWRGDVDRIRDDKRGYRGERLANGRGDQPAVLRKKTRALRDGSHCGKHTAMAALGPMTQPNRMPIVGLKPKDLIGIPWRLAFALQENGWWLRSDVVWAKPNPMPESITDRPTKSHEYVFLLAKSRRYYFDAEAAREPRQSEDSAKVAGWAVGPGSHSAVEHARDKGNARTFRGGQYTNGRKFDNSHATARDSVGNQPPPTAGRNMRSVWTIATQGYGGEHFATFPEELARRCIVAGTSAGGCCPACGAPLTRVVEKGEHDRAHQVACGSSADGTYKGEATKDFAGNGVQNASAVKARILAGMRKRSTVGWRASCKCDAGAPVPCTVLDVFTGTSTTGVVALRHGRSFIGIDLNPRYIEMSRKRLRAVAPLFTRSLA